MNKPPDEAAIDREAKLLARAIEMANQKMIEYLDRPHTAPVCETCGTSADVIQALRPDGVPHMYCNACKPFAVKP